MVQEKKINPEAVDWKKIKERELKKIYSEPHTCPISHY